mmetsp:Transcript_47268/g.152342  ORF Transcript_47268/g.152342 Transcript_47268/m.152342 type:complete len:122 (+) Transcript_47268:59-424(+)
MALLLSSLTSGLTIGAAPRPHVARAGMPTAALVADDDKVLTGACKWFNSEKGFGFVSVEGEDQDLFVHQTEIYADGFRSLAEGEPLEFKCTEDPRTGKLRAMGVTGPGGSVVQGAPRRDDW